MNRKWKDWDISEEKPGIRRTKEVTDENIPVIKRIIRRNRGYHFRSWDGEILNISIPGNDNLMLREGDYLTIAARKLERMHEEDYDRNYEPAMSKADLLEKIEALEGMIRNLR